MRGISMNKYFKSHLSNKLSLWIVGIILAWFIIAFLIVPNVNILYTTFFADGAFSLEPFEKLLSSERAMKSLFNSFLLGITLVVTVNIVGVFLVLVTDYFDIKGAKVLRLGYFTTMIYGGLILVFGYQFIYGKSGFLTSFISEDISKYESRLVCRLSSCCVCDDLCLYNESCSFSIKCH